MDTISFIRKIHRDEIERLEDQLAEVLQQVKTLEVSLKMNQDLADAQSRALLEARSAAQWYFECLLGAADEIGELTNTDPRSRKIAIISHAEKTYPFINTKSAFSVYEVVLICYPPTVQTTDTPPFLEPPKGGKIHAIRSIRNAIREATGSVVSLAKIRDFVDDLPSVIYSGDADSAFRISSQLRNEGLSVEVRKTDG